MEFFGIIVFILVLCCMEETSKIKRLDSRIKKLERKNNGGNVEMSRLINELKDKKCKIINDDLMSFTGTAVSECYVLDTDGDWVKVRIRNEKKNIEAIKLLKIENISAIEVAE